MEDGAEERGDVGKDQVDVGLLLLLEQEDDVEGDVFRSDDDACRRLEEASEDSISEHMHHEVTGRTTEPLKRRSVEAWRWRRDNPRPDAYHRLPAFW